MDGGKFKRRLSEVNATALSRGQNELVVKFKMAAGDLVNIREQVMEYTYIPTGIKRELVDLVCIATGRGKSLDFIFHLHGRYVHTTNVNENLCF